MKLFEKPEMNVVEIVSEEITDSVIIGNGGVQDNVPE